MRENESDMGNDKGKVARRGQNQLQRFGLTRARTTNKHFQDYKGTRKEKS
jgi:hypothetical protein